MTHRAAGSRRGIPKAWLLPLLVVALIALAIYLELVSRSIIVDFLAWWPVWLLLVLATVLARGRSWRRLRLSGVVPVLWVVALGLFTAGHILGWQAMPSASNRLVGPSPAAGSNVALSAHIDGSLRVGSGQSDFLYVVEPIRRGGDVGTPEAVEQVQGTNISVRLSPIADPGLYTFSGWDLELHPGPTWNLSLDGDVEAVLTGLRLSGLQVNGAGTVDLGTANTSVVVNVSGAFTVTLPPGIPARVIGDANVPDGWLEDGQGAASPIAGEGWVISVGDGSSLTVIEG